ncbi:MAG TPA: hypothetical protein VH538_10755 [Gaiellaceae bacterium]
MRRAVLLGVAIAAVAGSAASAGGRAAGPAPLLAVVRSGTPPACGLGGPLGSQPPVAVIHPPVVNCPPPVQCATTAPKSGRAPACPKPRVDAIYLVAADGRDPRRFAAGVEPAWSPDGAELAYVTDDGRFLAVEGVGGTPPMDTIAALPNALARTGRIGDPSWSPDGSDIVFTVYETNDSITGGEWRQQLYTVDLAQRNVRQLTETATDESDESPAFSPDGSEIAYAHWGTQRGIWLVRPDGSDAHPIAATGGYAAGVSWSPDGRAIAFAQLGFAGDSGIYVVDADGSDLHRVAVTGDLYILDRPTWSPDGQEIEFTAADASAGTRALYAVRADGSDEHVVLREPWPVYQPAWQP